MTPAASRARLVELLSPVVEVAGLELEDVQVTPAGKRRVVRVLVDADDGVSLDAVAVASRSVSDLLDGLEGAQDPLGGTPYVLEVSTPGVDRPLTAERHWRRNRGRLVKVLLAAGGEVTGRVLAADAEGADLDVDGAVHRVALSDVARATVQVEFNRPGAAAADTEDDLDDDLEDDLDDDLDETDETDADDADDETDEQDAGEHR